MRHFSILWWAIEKLLRFLADSTIKSPLEQDFGEASDDDVIPPEDSFTFEGDVSEFQRVMIRVDQSIPGLSPDKVTILLNRTKELPTGRTAQFSFLPRHNHETCELRVNMTKKPGGKIIAIFSSSLALTARVELACNQITTETAV